MKKALIFIFFLLFLNAVGVHAQILTLDEVVRIAQDSTVASHMSSSSFQQARWEYEQFLALRRPQISFGMNPGYQKMTFEPATAFYKERNYNMFNALAEIRMEQKALGIGGKFYASTGALWTRYFNQSSPMRLFSSIPLGIGYSNELVAYNPYKWEKELNELKIRNSEKVYRNDLASIALESVKLYMSYYVALSRYDICVTNAEVARRLLSIGREKFGIASISKNELSALELQSLNAENSLFSAGQQMEDARGRLLSYLKIEDKGQPLQLEEPLFPGFKNINADEAVELAKANNPKYLKTCEDIVSARQQAQKAKIQGRFLQTGVDLNFGIQNTSAAFADFYVGQQPFFTGNITFRIPIYDGGLAKSRSKIAEYRLDNARTAEREVARQLELDVITALRDFNIQQDLLDRTRYALNLADESFELVRDLYSNGETDINTFILAQNRKDEAHANYLNSISAYWTSYYTLKMLCDSEF